MNAPVLVEVSCQVCGSHDSEEAYTRQVETPEHGHVSMRLLLCRGCGFVYTSPRPTRAVVRARRAGPALGERATERRLARCQDAFVRRAVELVGPGRWLDIGSGRRGQLGTLRLPGWQHVCLEPSRSVAEEARGRGLDVIETTLEENPLASGSFDLITCPGLLERAFDVREVAFALERLLRPNGLLVVHALDVSRPKAGIPDFFAHDRLSHFTASSLSRLLVDFGFRPLAIESSDAPGILFCARKEDHDSVMDVPISHDHEHLRQRLARYRREQSSLGAAIHRRFARLAQRWDADLMRLAIYGADEHARFLLDLVDLTERVVVVVDADPARQGEPFLRWKVRDPRAAYEQHVDAIVVASGASSPAERQMLSELELVHGIELVRFLAPDRASAA